LVYVVEVIFEISLNDISFLFISIKPKEARSFLVLRASFKWQ